MYMFGSYNKEMNKIPYLSIAMRLDVAVILHQSDDVQMLWDLHKQIFTELQCKCYKLYRLAALRDMVARCLMTTLATRQHLMLTFSFWQQWQSVSLTFRHQCRTVPTLWHWSRCVLWTLQDYCWNVLGPQCPGSKVSVKPSQHCSIIWLPCG